VEKYEEFFLPVEKYEDFFFLKKEDKIGLEGTLFNRWKLEGNEGLEACSKGNEGSEARLKGNEGSKAHYL
jgi:hypothetical protein